MYVKSITLEDVKGFKSLEFDFQRPSGGFEGWTVFLGGNASGKSTLLKSIALTITGPDASRQLLGSPAGWRGWIREDQRRAEAKATLTWDSSFDRFRGGGPNPGPSFEAGMRFALEGKEGGSSTEGGHDDEFPTLRAIVKTTPKRTRILTAQRGPWEPNALGWFSAGYGPMRRLTGSSSESVRFSLERGCVSRFVTLFREDAALSESETWLKTNHSRWLESKKPELKELVDRVGALLSDGMLPQGMKISEITVDHVYLEDGRGLKLPMRDISDGCRSIYATVLDLVHGMFTVYGIDGLFEEDSGKLVVSRPGVVLIDEIEAHLHPSWQREIPEWFKQHFPKVQFFATTHSPLVAQAADPNGVFLLPSLTDRDTSPRALSPEETERLRLGRAEKTLLGVAFGLRTVRSRWAVNQIDKWKRLNAKSKAGVSLDASEENELGELKQQMEIAFDQVPETH